MIKLFVSYQYVGSHKNDNNIYQGFGSTILSVENEPEDLETLEDLVVTIDAFLRLNMGFSTVSSSILFYKTVGSKHNSLDTPELEA